MSTASPASSLWGLAWSLVWDCTGYFARQLPRRLSLGLAGSLAVGLAATLLVPSSRLGEEWAQRLEVLILAGFGMAGLLVGLVRAISDCAERVKAAVQSRCSAAVEAVLESVGWSSDRGIVIPDGFRDQWQSWLRDPLADSETLPGSWRARFAGVVVRRKLRTTFQPAFAIVERALQNAGDGSAAEIRTALQQELVGFLGGIVDRQIHLSRVTGYLLASMLAGGPLLLVALAWIVAPSA